MHLYELIDDFRPEDAQVECKRRLNRDNFKGWLKTVDGFANKCGGVFYLGVEDKNYELNGYDLEELDNEKLYFSQMLSNHFKTTIGTQIEAIPYEVRGKTRYILKIKIFESAYKPVFLYIDNDALVYVRNDGKTSPATSENIYFMAKNYAYPSFDIQPTDIPFHKEDFTKLYDFYKKRNHNEELTEKLLGSIEFFDRSFHLKKGATLFADKCADVDTLIHCNTFNSNTRGDNWVVDTQDFIGNLVDSFNFMYDYIDKRMNHGFLKTELSRQDVTSYPPRALTEALINALVHRDYTMDGTQISVDIFKNRLAITSPGSLFEKNDIAPTYHFDSFLSTRRNKLICDVFVLCKAMEARGTGFEKILKEYEKADDSHKPFVFSKNNQFTIVLPDLTNEEGVDISDECLTVVNESQYKFSKYSRKILAFCYGKQRTIREITEELNLSNSTYFKQEFLNPLVESGLLTSAKIGNALAYRTNHEKVSLS